MRSTIPSTSRSTPGSSTSARNRWMWSCSSSLATSTSLIEIVLTSSVLTYNLLSRRKDTLAREGEPDVRARLTYGIHPDAPRASAARLAHDRDLPQARARRVADPSWSSLGAGAETLRFPA